MAQTYFVDLPFLNLVMFQFANSNSLPEDISMYIPLCSSSVPQCFLLLHLLMIRWQSSLFEESASSWFVKNGIQKWQVDKTIDNLSV